MGGQPFQVGASVRSRGRLFREKELRQDAHVGFDGDHPPRDLGGLGRPKGLMASSKGSASRPRSAQEITAGNRPFATEKTCDMTWFLRLR